MRNRIIAICLTVVMVLGLVPFTAIVANAAEPQWLWPAKNCYVVYSNFGHRDLNGNGNLYDDTPHLGIDIVGSSSTFGQPVLAAKSGTVYQYCNSFGDYEHVSLNDTTMRSYGNYVILKHDDGTYTIYAHMRKSGIKTGGTVKQGDVIGYIGESGSVTGTHLHFQIFTNPNNKGSTSLNPMPTNSNIYIKNQYALPTNWASARQTYIFEPWDDSASYENLGDDFYAYLEHNASRYGIANVNGNVELGDYGDSLWHFVRNSDNSYQIFSILDGNAMDVTENKTANYTNIQTYAPNTSTAQKWYIKAVGDGYSLISASSRKALDIADASAEYGTNAWIYTANSTPAQVLNIIRTHQVTYDTDGTITSEWFPAGQIITLPYKEPDHFNPWNFAYWKSDGVRYEVGDTVAVTENMTFDAIYKGEMIGEPHSDYEIEYTISYPGVGVYFIIYPDVSQTYCFVGMETDVDTVIKLYDADGNVLAQDDDSGGNRQFRLEYNLTAEKVYYAYVYAYSRSYTGPLKLKVTESTRTVTFDTAGTVTTQEVATGDTLTLPYLTPDYFYPHNLKAWMATDGTLYAPGDSVTVWEDTTFTAQHRTWLVNQDYGYVFDSYGSGRYLCIQPETSRLYCFWGIAEFGRDSNPDTVIKLYDADGNLLAQDDDSGGNYQFRLEYYLVAGETYYIYVYPYSSSYVGSVYFNVSSRMCVVTYDACGGSNAPASLRDYYRSTVQISDQIPQKTGYIFGGWNNVSDGTVYDPGDSIYLQDNMTLQAVWEECPHDGTITNNVCDICGERFYDRTVFVDISGTGWSGVNVYTWTEDQVPCTGDWPGSAMTHVRENIYSFVVPYNANYIIFNNGIIQTGDLTVPTDGRNVYLLTSGVWESCTTRNMHVYDDGQLESHPYCEVPATRTYTCVICGSCKYETVPATGHNYSSKITTAATCTADGLKTYTCANCKETYTEVIPATGHNYSAVVTKPTCTENGYTTYTCVCGLNYIADEKPATGHSLYTEAGPPQMVEYCPDVKEYFELCHYCDYRNSYLVPFGHSYQTVQVDATCVNDGSVTSVCVRCNHTQVEIIPATGHTPGEWVVVREETLTEDGLLGQYCTVCDELLATEIVDNHISGSCGADLTWHFDPETGSLTISGVGAMYDYSDGTAPWYEYASSIETVVVDTGVTTVGNYAFARLHYMKTVLLPEGLTWIGDHAFYIYGSDAYPELTFSGDAPQFSDTAFSNTCVVIHYPESNDTWTEDVMFPVKGEHSCYGGWVSWENQSAVIGMCGDDLMAVYDKQSQKLTITGNGRINSSEGGVMHPWCNYRSDITEVFIADGCTSIADAFSRLTGLKKISLPDSLEKLGEYAFGRCTGLETISIPANVKKIGPGAFRYCSGLEAVTFCGDAPEMESDIFNGVTATVYYPAGNNTWVADVMQNYCGEITWVAYGEPSVVQPTLTLKAPTLEFKDMICVVAFFTAENTQDVVEMGMITYTEKVDLVDVATADHVIPGASYDEGSGRYFASSQGIHAKYLGDTVYLACYAKLTDGSYVYTRLAPYSPIQYANSQLKNSTDIKLKQLVVAMLNYGAEAQRYFGHNVESLANSTLTADQLALPESYRQDMVQPVPVASAQKQGIFANNQGFAARKPAISFEGAFCINYFFTPKYEPVHGITLYYWNEADFNAADVLTTENATGTVELDGTGVGQYRGDITGIAAKSLSQAVYVAAIYSDGPTIWTSGVLGYSIGTYCSSQASTAGDIAHLAKATAVYGYCAKQYFG